MELGLRTKSWTSQRCPDGGSACTDRDTVELLLLALDEGMGVTRAAREVGVSLDTARRWAAGMLPRSCAAAPRASGRIGADEARTTRGGARVKKIEDRGAVRAARDGAARRDDARPDREAAAQGGVGRPKRGRLAPPFDPDAEQVRARREIEAGDRSADVDDYPFP